MPSHISIHHALQLKMKRYRVKKITNMENLASFRPKEKEKEVCKNYVENK